MLGLPASQMNAGVITGDAFDQRAEGMAAADDADRLIPALGVMHQIG
jgi:hypothetical protein